MQPVLNKWCAALLLIALMGAAARASDWERSVALYNKGDYAAALAEFQDVIAERPDAAGAWYYIGLCEYKLKRYDRVETPMARAIDLMEVQSPAGAEIAGAWYTLGISHYLAGRYDKAVEPLKHYIELNTSAKREIEAAARTALGRAYYQLERFDEAEAAFAAANGKTGAAEKSAEKSKEAGVNYYYLGAIYFKREDDDRAIAALREAVKVNPEETAAMDLLAESL